MCDGEGIEIEFFRQRMKIRVKYCFKKKEEKNEIHCRAAERCFQKMRPCGHFFNRVVAFDLILVDWQQNTQNVHQKFENVAQKCEKLRENDVSSIRVIMA